MVAGDGPWLLPSLLLRSALMGPLRALGCFFMTSWMSMKKAIAGCHGSSLFVSSSLPSQVIMY